jgi:helix-turn-helix protein
MSFLIGGTINSKRSTSELLDRAEITLTNAMSGSTIRACIEKGAQKHLVKRIVGHSQDDQITLGVYSDVDKISLKALKGVLDCNLNWLI